MSMPSRPTVSRIIGVPREAFLKVQEYQTVARAVLKRWSPSACGARAGGRP
jgi:hypothetical protein